MHSAQWKPGVSGNPAGGVVGMTATVADVVKVARRKLTKPAIEVLLRAMLDPNAPWNARIRAAEISLERAWGPAKDLDEALRNAKPEELERIAKQIIDMRARAREAVATVVPITN